jgi:hypothetical protein
VTPEQEGRANDAANEILAELRAATSPQECAEIGERNAKIFARLQEVHPVRAIHIVNLAKMKKREFENGFKAISTKSPRRNMELSENDNFDLFD